MTTISPRDAAWREELRKAHSPKERTAIPRAKMTELSPAYRVTCNEEVNQGLSREQAVLRQHAASTVPIRNVLRDVLWESISPDSSRI